MTKKRFLTSQDKKDWEKFTNNPHYIYDKEPNFNKKIEKTNKIDLHGLSLIEANKKVKKLINESFEQEYEKLIIITGKGLRSKVHEDPYRSEKMSVLKFSIPEYIKSDKDLSSKISKISQAEVKDGGEGAIYIFLKKNNDL